MRCEWVKEFLRKGIALIGREGRTLSPSGRGGMGWGGALPPSGGRGCPPGKGAWGSKNSESLSQERTEAIARASTVDKSMLAFDFWRHSNNKQSAGYRLRRPQGSFPLSSPPFIPPRTYAHCSRNSAYFAPTATSTHHIIRSRSCGLMDKAPPS